MEDYELEIKQLQDKMDKAKEFAEHLPCFKEIILTRKLAFRDKLLDEKEKLTKRLAYIENQLEEFKED